MLLSIVNNVFATYAENLFAKNLPYNGNINITASPAGFEGIAAKIIEKCSNGRTELCC